MRILARIAAILLVIPVLLGSLASASTDEELPRFLQAAQTGMFAQRLTLSQICDFVQLARPRNNLIKAKRISDYRIRLYAEDFISEIWGEDDLYDYSTILHVIGNTPQIFDEQYFTPDDIRHFLISDAGVTAPVDMAISDDQSLLIVTIGERRYELPISHWTETPHVNDVEAFRILWDIYPAEDFLPQANTDSSD